MNVTTVQPHMSSESVLATAIKYYRPAVFSLPAQIEADSSQLTSATQSVHSSSSTCTADVGACVLGQPEQVWSDVVWYERGMSFLFSQSS